MRIDLCSASCCYCVCFLLFFLFFAALVANTGDIICSSRRVLRARRRTSWWGLLLDKCAAPTTNADRRLRPGQPREIHCTSLGLLLGQNWSLCYSLSTLATIVADFGDNLSQNTATVAEFGDCRLSRRFRWQCGQGFIGLKQVVYECTIWIRYCSGRVAHTASQWRHTRRAGVR